MKREISMVVGVVLLLLGLVGPAWGYTDPGSGLLLWQVVAAAFVGVLFQIRRFFSKVRTSRQQEQQTTPEEPIRTE